MKIETGYSRIALLTLITSSLILITNIIGFIYDIAMKKYTDLQSKYKEYTQKKEIS